METFERNGYIVERKAWMSDDYWERYEKSRCGKRYGASNKPSYYGIKKDDRKTHETLSSSNG